MGRGPRHSARAPREPPTSLEAALRSLGYATKGALRKPQSPYLRGVGGSFVEFLYQTTGVRYIRGMDANTDSLNSNSTNAVSAVYELEPWMTKQQLSNHLSMSVRWIEMCVRAGMPMMHFGNRARFKVSQVENWISKQAKGTRQ